MQINNSIEKIRSIIYVVLVIINSGYALTTGLSNICAVITLFFVGIDFVLFKGRINFKAPQTVLLAVFLFEMMVTCVVNIDLAGIKEYFRIIIFFTFAWRICTVFDTEQIIYSFCKLMRISGVIALIFYFLVSFVPGLPYPTITNSYGVSYYTCLFASVNTFASWRNSGLFWEAGMLSGLTFLWQICEMFCEQELPRKKLFYILSIILIFTTMSTAGYIYILLLFILLFVKNKKIKESGAICFFVIMVVILMLYLYQNMDELIENLVVWNPRVFEKLVLKNASYSDRTVGPLVDMYISIRNPLGIGVTSLAEKTREVASLVFMTKLTSRTSSITYYFASFGIICGFTVVIRILKFIRAFSKDNLEFTILLLGIVILCLSTPLNSSVIFIIILFLDKKNIVEKMETRD